MREQSGFEFAIFFFSISIFFLHFSFDLKIYLKDDSEIQEKITNKKIY